MTQEEQLQQSTIHASISATLTQISLNFDTNGDRNIRFWNVNLHLTETDGRPAEVLPFTLFAPLGVVGAVIAMRPTSDTKDIESAIHTSLSTIAMVRFIAPIEEGGLAFLRADVAWMEPLALLSQKLLPAKHFRS